MFLSSKRTTVFLPKDPIACITLSSSSGEKALLHIRRETRNRARNKSLPVHKPLLDYTQSECEKREFTAKRDLASEPNWGGFSVKVRAIFFSPDQS